MDTAAACSTEPIGNATNASLSLAAAPTNIVQIYPAIAPRIFAIIP